MIFRLLFIKFAIVGWNMGFHGTPNFYNKILSGEGCEGCIANLSFSL